MTADFTPEQAARLARIEAAPDAPESLRERVAVALHAHDRPTLRFVDDPPEGRDEYREMADAALAVIRGQVRP